MYSGIKKKETVQLHFKSSGEEKTYKRNIIRTSPMLQCALQFCLGNHAVYNEILRQDINEAISAT